MESHCQSSRGRHDTLHFVIPSASEESSACIQQILRLAQDDILREPCRDKVITNPIIIPGRHDKLHFVIPSASEESSACMQQILRFAQDDIVEDHCLLSPADLIPPLCHSERQRGIFEVKSSWSFYTMKHYYVYIMASYQKSLYIGITNDLIKRVYQHKNKSFPNSFTSRYNIFRLVYLEVFNNAHDAISREKQLKGWRRSKKITLIESENPNWDDLSLDWE